MSISIFVWKLHNCQKPDAVIIARPFVNMIYGNGEQGVEAYVQQLGQELENTMMMTGVSSLNEISKKNIYK